MNLMRKLNIPFENVIEKVKNGLKEEGFGILTEIDVKETLKKIKPSPSAPSGSGEAGCAAPRHPML